MSNKLILQINKNYTSSSKEILELKLYVDNLMQEVGILYRIDNACDFKESLEENLKLYRAFICCLAYINYGTIEIYETKKDRRISAAISKKRFRFSFLIILHSAHPR